jgi:hypothetical protein
MPIALACLAQARGQAHCADSCLQLFCVLRGCLRLSSSLRRRHGGDGQALAAARGPLLLTTLGLLGLLLQGGGGGARCPLQGWPGD